MLLAIESLPINYSGPTHNICQHKGICPTLHTGRNASSNCTIHDCGTVIYQLTVESKGGVAADQTLQIINYSIQKLKRIFCYFRSLLSQARLELDDKTESRS